jgi:signal transduction histidine kinase
MSFRFKTVMGIALIEAGLLLLLVLSGLTYLRTSNEEALATKASTMARLFATTIKRAVIATDLASLEEFMDEVAKNPDLVYAAVTDASGRPLTSRGVLPPTVGHAAAHAEIAEGGIRFGTVEIVFDKQGIEKTVGHARNVFTAIALLEMLLVGLFSLLLGTHLTRQLKWLESGARRLESGEADFAIPVHGRDELAATARAFNAMTKAIAVAQETLRREHAELILHKTHLETLVGLKTAELVAAKDQAEAANRSKSAFLATMSHEIRTPINAVLGLAHLLEHSALDEEQRNFITKISLAGQSLLSIINDVLDFSRVEAGRLELDHTAFQLTGVLDALSTIMSVDAGAKNIELVIAADDDVPPKLVGDMHRLQQILINLVGNAIKFTDAGVVALRVALTARDEERVTLRFSVQDTGVGIAADKLTMLFDAFAQADSSTTRCYGGSGLGLAISKRLVELMGGTIGVDSTPGQGSTFWFTLTLAVAPPQTATANGTPLDGPIAASQRPAGHGLEGVRILVVEDNAVNQIIAKGMLERHGARVAVVGDGRQAVELIEANRDDFDLVLMDVQMPVMDGYEATRRIRDDLGLVGLPIIALTAGVFQTERDKALAAGMVDFIGKPFTIAEMLRVIGAHLGAS